MKYLLLLPLFFGSYFVEAQGNCEDASAYLMNSYAHVKDAYDSNNISHLKYYANRSLESLKLSKNNLADCNCQKALDLANQTLDLLVKVEDVETNDDGRFFVKRARDLSKESVIEIDKCAYNNANGIENTEENALANLQKEQELLQEQQAALKRKEAEIKEKLAQQQDEALALQKKQLISKYKLAISSNIKTYNETLKLCDANHESMKTTENDTDLSSKSIEAIKDFYISSLKDLAAAYTTELGLCGN
jgi:vacuolar-type H+-ATPase subunit I/STV1